MDSELIEKLLQTTGLSCDDLLAKLQQYKTTQSNPEEDKQNECLVSDQKGNEVQECSKNNDNSVILETQSSTVDCSDDTTHQKDEIEGSSKTDNALCKSIEEEKENHEEISDITLDEKIDDKSVENTIEEDLQYNKENCKAIVNNATEEKINAASKNDEKISEEVEEQFLEIAQNIKAQIIEEKHDNFDKNYEDLKKNLLKEDLKMFSEDSSDNSVDTNVQNYTNLLSRLEEDDSMSCTSDIPKPSLNSSETVTSVQPEIVTSTVTILPESEERLRDVLRRQLSSLRNMKKCSGILPDFKKRNMLFHNLKKKRKSCDMNPIKPLDSEEEFKKLLNIDEEPKNSLNIDEEVKKTEDCKDLSNENSIVSLSDETDFLIVNVTGGIDVLESELNEKDKIEERCFASVSNKDASNDSNQTSSTLNTGKSIDSATKNFSPTKEIRNILTNHRKKMSLNYFDAKSFNFSTPKSQEKPLLSISVRKDICDNFEKDPGISTSVKISEKSPFVSDSLDDFLNESAQLKISYAIPKLGAEEGINESTKEISPFDGVVKVNRVEPVIERKSPQKEKSTKLIKAKTLADMRRQFEKLKKKEMKLNSSKAEIKTTDQVLRRNSFIMYNNKKIWVSSRNRNSCITVLDSSDNSPKSIKSELDSPPPSITKKPSLLSTLQRQKPKVTYKPGPLCKKNLLQNLDSRDEWTTEIKTLPKIFLEVTPEIRKVISPEIIHLVPIFDKCVITKERTDFALSVLKSKNENTDLKSFIFEIPYKNNQTQTVVRRKAKRVLLEKPLEISDLEPEKEIVKILDGIKNYVEVKEIEDSLIKEDDTVLDDLEKVSEGTSKIKIQDEKFKRLSKELLRLNCKVIDVATEETEVVKCKQPFCKLGCVCKSLRCECVISDHCQLVDCMFGCKCPPTRRNRSKNSLPDHTVNHLEDKAKKNLAKVEREFTQTLIHTDDDVIFVGRGKIRRASKAPKKYTDYIADIDFEKTEREIDGMILKKVKECHVVLWRLDLSNLRPLCLYHKMYDCECRGEYVEASPKKRKLEEIPKLRIVKTKGDYRKSWSESSAKIRKLVYEAKNENHGKDYLQNIINNVVDTSFKPSKEEPKKDSKRKQSFSNIIDETPKFEVVRNRDKSPRQKVKRKRTFNIIDETPKFDLGKHRDNQLEPPRKKLCSAEKTKVKEFALQRRKKKITVLKNSREVSPAKKGIFDGEIKISLKDNKSILPLVNNKKVSFDYIRILPWSKLIENFHSGKMLIWSKFDGTSILCNAAGYFPPKNYVSIMDIQKRSEFIQWIISDDLPANRPRDLMHVILIPKYQHFMISGYCLKKQPIQEKPAENVASSSSSTNYNSFENVSITNSEGKELNLNYKQPTHGPKRPALKTVRKVVPLGSVKRNLETSAVAENTKLRSVLSSVESLTQGGLEILPLEEAITTQNEDKTEIGGVIIEPVKPTTESSQSSKTISDESEVYDLGKVTASKKSNFGAILPNRTHKCTHRNMDNKDKTLCMTNKEFTKRRLYPENNVKGVVVIAPLPKVPKNLRWRMIYLNSDFSFLCFVNATYSIKYTDLLDVVKMANTVRSTIILRNNEFCDFYKSLHFGIYCVPDYQDRLFIGPYFPTEKHNIETLRYLQGKLIETETFNIVFGQKNNPKSPVWVYETPRPEFSNSLVIDITDDEENENTNKDLCEKGFLCPPFAEEINDLKGVNRVNRYIMTNIPHLGYLVAYQNGTEIEVYWPGHTKSYKFPNAVLARFVLINYLSQIFCPVPQSFKINVLIMTNVDKQSISPASLKYFEHPGPLFCGDFGICEKLSEDLLLKYEIASVESLLEAHKEWLEDFKIKVFGVLISPQGEMMNNYEEILNLAKSEIYVLKRLGQNYESQTSDLKKMLQRKSAVIKQYSRELVYPVTNKKISETIEIPDSDEETTGNKSPVTSSTFLKIGTSGKIVSKKTSDRSLLKSKIYIKPGHSLLRKSDTGKDVTTAAGPPQSKKVLVEYDKFF